MAGTGNRENERDPYRDAGGEGMAMTMESHVARGRQCHRTRVVAGSDLRPPAFPHIEAQAEGPEILERRGSGDETLLTMRCGALGGSFAESLQHATVDV